MREPSPSDLVSLARSTFERKSKSGKTTYHGRYFETEQEVIDAYAEFVRLRTLWMHDYDNVTDPEQRRQIEKLAEFGTDLSKRMFEAEFPAMRVLFKNFLTQH